MAELSEQIEYWLDRLAPGSSLVLVMWGRKWLLSRRTGQPGHHMAMLE